MTHYRHDPAPNHRAAQFIAYCAEHITEWPRGQFAATSGKFKKFHFTERVNSLSPTCWVTCSHKQWLAAKAMMATRPSPQPTTPVSFNAHGVPVQKTTSPAAYLLRWIKQVFLHHTA